MHGKKIFFRSLLRGPFAFNSPAYCFPRIPQLFHLLLAQEKQAACSLGADSPFFALLGSAPQELNTVRPEAKTGVLKIARTKSKHIFYCALAVDALYPRMTIAPTIRTIFSLTRLVVVDT